MTDLRQLLLCRPGQPCGGRFALRRIHAHVTIALLSQLPGITSTLTIDGYTQSGAAPNTNSTSSGGLNAVLQIELVGTGGVYGFYTDKANGVILTVQGLVMHGFIANLFGAPVAGTSQLRAFGNYFCTNADGTAAATGPTTGLGVGTNETPAFVGGDLAAQRNLISGCGSSAIDIRSTTQVRGNLIGTDATGSVAIPNGTSAISITSDSVNVGIGGADATATRSAATTASAASCYPPTHRAGPCPKSSRIFARWSAKPRCQRAILSRWAGSFRRRKKPPGWWACCPSSRWC